MAKGAFLSDAINLNDLVTYKLNLICAPRGSGKTTFALDVLPKLATRKGHILFLIDTVAGLNCLLKRAGIAFYSDAWRDHYSREEFYINATYFTTESSDEVNMIHVMTYAKFGVEYKKNPKFIADLQVVICDELHNCYIFADYGKNTEYGTSSEYYQYAQTAIQVLSFKPDCYVVALTATPRRVEKEVSEKYRVTIQPTCEVRHYENRIIRRFKNLNYVLDNIKPGEKCMIYIPHITDMLIYRNQLRKRGLSCEAVWSERNPTHSMSENQYRILRHISAQEQIPDDIDILIFNAALATSININGHIDKVIIFDIDPDVIIQARGRYRDDLDILYYLDKVYIDAESIEEYLDRPLFDTDKETLCQLLAFPNGRIKGDYCKWPTIRKYLEKSEYLVKEGRSNDKRYVIISASSSQF